jgi:hypothetical protein
MASGRLERSLVRLVGPDERKLFSIHGAPGQLLAALDRRVLILKTGLEAGLPFRAKAHSFDYGTLDGFRVQPGSALAALWLDVKGYSPPDRQIWQSADPARDPFRAPNGFPLPLEALRRSEEHLAVLRDAIAAARTGPGGPLVDELERLAALRDSAALTEDEFERAKRLLLE